MRLNHSPRPGAVTVEFAIVCPVAFTLLLAILIGGLAVFRFQEVATLAREAARYASVHGGQYARETGQPAATATTIRDYVLAKAVALDSNSLTCTVSWNTDNMPVHTVIINGQPTAVANTVTVTISYQWIPETFFSGGSTMTSTSVLPMSF